MGFLRPLEPYKAFRASTCFEGPYKDLKGFIRPFLELCPKRFHHLLRQHLFGGGIDDFMLQAIEGQIKEGMEDAKKLSEAMAIGMAAKGPAVAPMPPTPPQATEAGKTLEQQQKEAKAAWHASREVL